MARPSRYQQNDDDEGQRPRRRPKKQGPPLVPILALIVVMAGAVYLARQAAQNKPEEEPPKEEVRAAEIFGDLPEEEPPDRSGFGQGGRKLTNTAPAGLAENPTWIQAQEVAAEAAAVLTVAKGAKAAGDHAVWSEKGNEAKELYDKAIIMTADWEDELMAQYGDKDRQVKAIMNERSKWFDLLRTLHKTTGR